QIGIAARSDLADYDADTTDTGTKAGEGAAAGAITGGAFGTLAGLAVAAGMIPAIGPVIAGGILAGLVASAAVGAAAGGILVPLTTGLGTCLLTSATGLSANPVSSEAWFLYPLSEGLARPSLSVSFRPCPYQEKAG